MKKLLLLIVFIATIILISISYILYNQNVKEKEKLVFIDEIGKKSNIIQEETNTERIFDENPKLSVSNSNTTPGTCVYKSFDVMKNEELQLNEFLLSNEIYYKKIISYDEYLKYKNMWNLIRELTEEDFINYYLVIAINKNAKDNISYTFKKILVENECLNLYITQRDTEFKERIATGIAIIIPNRTDFEQNKINIINE